MVDAVTRTDPLPRRTGAVPERAVLVRETGLATGAAVRRIGLQIDARTAAGDLAPRAVALGAAADRVTVDVTAGAERRLALLAGVRVDDTVAAPDREAARVALRRAGWLALLAAGGIDDVVAAARQRGGERLSDAQARGGDHALHAFARAVEARAEPHPAGDPRAADPARADERDRLLLREPHRRRGAAVAERQELRVSGSHDERVVDQLDAAGGDDRGGRPLHQIAAARALDPPLRHQRHAGDDERERARGASKPRHPRSGPHAIVDSNRRATHRRNRHGTQRRVAARFRATMRDAHGCMTRCPSGRAGVSHRPC